MAAPESEQLIQQRILTAYGSGSSKLWRNVVGTGWQGRDALGRNCIRPITRENLQEARAKLQPGDIVIRNPRILHAGLCVSSSDAIGVARVVVTEAMVGQVHGLFSAVEVKRPVPPYDWKRMTEQAKYIRSIRAMGGLAGFARSVEEAGEILRGGRGWEPKDWQFPAPPII